MSVDARLEAVPVVEIDKGVFKYILIKVYGKEKSDGSEHQKLIVRFVKVFFASCQGIHISLFLNSQGFCTM